VRALVTGGAKRIGKVIALALADAGYDIVLHYFTSTIEAQKTADEIRAKEVSCDLARVDLADPMAAQLLMSKARPVDVLINNAAVFDTSPAADAMHQLQINSLIPVELARSMPAGSVVINITDVNALHVAANSYARSKLELHRQTEVLANELGPEIRVNDVALGAVLSPSLPPDGYVHVKKEETPRGKFPTPEEVAEAVLKLVTDKDINGKTIRVE
jgi:glucose 1-dehydrogenase